MTKERNDRDNFAAGTAAALHKIELAGFTEETQVLAAQIFVSIARNLAKKNHFGPDEWAAMDALALADLLADDSIAWDPTDSLTLEQYLAGVIARKLRHAAAKVADERSVWTESRSSLDSPCGSEEGDATLCDLVMDGANLEVNRKLIAQPRAVAIRHRIKRLQNAKDYAGLARYRAALAGLPEAILPSEADEELENDTEQSEDEVDETQPADDFADDPDTLNHTVFDAKAHHAQAVAEVGYQESDDDLPPVQTAVRTRSPGFGHVASVNRHFVLKMDVKALIATLPRRLRRLCRLMMSVENPETAYKLLGISKNDYFKHIRPVLRQVFAELRGAY